MTSSQRRHTPPPPIAPAKGIELRVRGDFVDWLADTRGTLAVTTYNSGKLAFFSAVGGELKSSFWRFPRPMGLAISGAQMALATQRHVWLFRLFEEDPPAPSPRRGGLGRGEDASTSFNPLPDPPLMGEGAVGSDVITLPLGCRLQVESTYATGRLDAHDLAFDRRGLLFANTKFNCVARPSERVNFARLWQPPFIAGIARGDRCHLNGVGVRNGRLAMATAFCEADAPSAWRGENRFASGVLIDVPRNEVVARGLCMPHSPRWHDKHWWFCNSGEGALCLHVRDHTRTEPVAILPGFTRGLTFAAGRAIVGLSRIRKRHILDAPPVRERFRKMRSGVWLVHPASGRVTGALEFLRGGREVYDVAMVSRLEGSSRRKDATDDQAMEYDSRR
jgi:uncharacterized protein (TIGR03032 family)